MLDRAVRNAAARGLDLRTVHCDWRDLPSAVSDRFDAIVCLGSSFPHLFEEAARRAALAAFFNMLKPGGLLIVDHRNFDAIRTGRYKSSGRYYYCGSGVNVSVAHCNATTCRFRYDFPNGDLHFLEVYPLGREELRTLLQEQGFGRITSYGDFHQDFEPLAPDFLIHVAHKL